MRRFWVFAMEVYYPQGGMDDIIGHFDSSDEAITAANGYLRNTRARCEVQVVDTVYWRIKTRDKALVGRQMKARRSKWSEWTPIIRHCEMKA